MSNARSVIIIGGGMSGLATAFWLRTWGVEATILEAQSEAGGTMKTVREGGWLIEEGPNSALETTPLLRDMFAALGIASQVTYPAPAAEARFILRGGTLHALPMTPGAFLSSRLWSVRGKLRLAREPFVGRAATEESVAQFVERRLGREFLDYAINPFVAGVFAGDPAALSVRAAFPKLYALEERYGGLVKGMIRGARERRERGETSKDRARLFSFRDGMQSFPRALSSFLGGHLRLSARVEEITPLPSDGLNRGPGFRVKVAGGKGQLLEADALVVATPAHAAASLLCSFDRVLAGQLEKIYYPPVAEVFLGYGPDAVARRLDGFGFLVPAKENRKILGTIWSSSLYRGRAPAGHHALTSFIGGARQPELAGLDEGALIDLCHGELAAILGARERPVFARVVRWAEAIPQYTLGYQQVLDALDSAERSVPGLYVCSNYRRGIAVGDCVMNGERIAARVAGFLGLTVKRPSYVTD